MVNKSNFNGGIMNVPFANGNITRTFFKCAAWAYVVSGINEDGTPKLESVPSGAFYASKENDIATAWKLIRDINKDAIKATVHVEVIDTVCIAMTLEDFFENGEAVERQSNGRVKK